MTQFVRSIMRFSWALTLLGIRELGTFFGSGRSMSSSGPGFSSPEKGIGAKPAPRFTASEDSTRASIPVRARNGARGGAVSSGRLNSARFIVMGEGLAAGIGDFNLSSEVQRSSFPALMAGQMRTEFKQPLFQPPGIEGLAGFREQPTVVPAPLQSTVLDTLPPGAVSNLSVPRLTLSDALNLRPIQPLIHRHDVKQTAVNLIWGALPIAQGLTSTLPTQLEYAIQQAPTLTIIELGYYEAIEAAVYGKPALIGDPGSCRAQYEQILKALKNAGSEVLLLTVPNPLDTAHFQALPTAAAVLKVAPDFLTTNYELAHSDLLTVKGLNEISFQMFGRSLQPLPAASVLKAEVGAEIRARIGSLNERLIDLAREFNVPVFDLHDLFRRVKEQGILIGSRKLNAEYLGGFYSLNGLYPGATGQAIIANEILQTLNGQYNADFAPVNLSAVLADDPVAAYRQAAGPSWNSTDIQKRIEEYRTPEREAKARREVHPQKAAGNVWEPINPADGSPPEQLRLPSGLEQVLPLNKELSYFGDGIGAINGRNPRDIQWGSSGNFLFGGLAMVDSHLSGNIRIQFSPPANGLTHFQVSFTDGFSGDDAVLVTPQFFKMAFQQNRVDGVPGTVSSGTLNLRTGEVTDLTIYASYRSTALLALVGVNPTFPKQPMSFPGQYGSAWARFEQRADGKLDFTFYGSTFVPLGKGIVWPLNFVGPSGQFATVPASGTVMHPHLHLSTKEVSQEDSGAGMPNIPFNTIQEFTLYTHNSSFGDAFHLNIPAVGGPAKGRSELLGRLQIQFGERTGNSVPFAVWALAPGGIMAELPDSPITQVFPGRLWAGPQGFNENLRFPQRTYPLDDLSILGDPFDICVGALDLLTGHSINDLLHRAFISQDLIFALLRVEPRTPKDSFFFRGPAWLEQDAHGGLVFRFQGIVRIPYPEGFRFPRPDFATGFVVGPNSRLDPFLWFHALQDTKLQGTAMEGSARHVRASTGDDFSYHYRIPTDPTDESPMFEYVNHTQNGHFRLHSLAWVGFSDSRSSSNGTNGCDTVTFSGFGVWSNAGLNTLQQAAVQISTSREKPYVGIQIASGDVSNVNTKPENERDALP
jgi:hypothetical protein